MEYSPSRRRKTSPISSVGVHERTLQRQAASLDCNKSAIRKASSLPPPKASVARFHSSLLPLTFRSSSQRQAGNSFIDFCARRSSTEVNTHVLVQGILGESGLVTSAHTPGNVPEADGQDSPERSRFEATTSKGSSAQSRKIKCRPVADDRASPPAGALESQDEVQSTRRTDHESREHSQVPASGIDGGEETTLASLDPHLLATPTRTIRQGAHTGMVLDQDGEPRLPSTPIHLGLEKPLESPRGLRYNSSAGRLQKRGATSTKSSSTKQQLLKSTESLSTPSTTRQKLGSRVYIAPTISPLLAMQEAGEVGIRDNIVQLEKQIQALEGELICRFLVSELQEGDDDTIKDLRRLQKEVISKCTQVMRLRQELVHDDPEEVAFDTRPGEKPNTQVSKKQAFSGKATSRSALSISASDRVVASRTRIVMIPGIGNCFFTASTFEINLLEEAPENSLIQLQVVELSSMLSSLKTRLLITINTTSQIITQIEVLELSTWAESEFGNYLRGVQTESNLATIGQRFMRYSTLCLERLKCWNDLASDFDALSMDNSGFQILPLPLDSVTPVNMMHLLCRQEYSLARGNVKVSFTWRISIDDEGDIRNDVRVWPEFPETWLQGAIGAEVAKVGKVFELLKKEKKENAVRQAIYTVVKLILSCGTPPTAAATIMQSPIRSSEA